MSGRGDSRLLIAGGGLAGCLAAMALARLRPEIPILLIEGEERFGGNHLWSCFEPDVAAADRWLIEPMIEASWDAHDVIFPKRSRTIATAYASLSSSRLDAAVRSRLSESQYRLGTAIAAVEPKAVILADGRRIEGRGAIDARGFSVLSTEERGALDLAWQKFVGRDVSLKSPHGLERPIVMDATVEQIDGYRFVYTLPFGPKRLMIEDTYYSTEPGLDRAAIGGRIDAYAQAQGWDVETIERQEKGVLPVALGGDFERFRPAGAAARIGVMGGFFHPTTGYSLPDAVRVAMLLAGLEDFDGTKLAAALDDEARKLWRERRFYRLLNRMLFRAADPEQRYRVLEHFYRLEPARIARFYGGRSNLWDKLRILSGKPPVPIGRALAAMRP
jgi:lycopene beta-cyclase